MAATKRNFLIWWIGGILIFAVSIFIHGPLAIDAVPKGILDHQAAPDAASVDAIQQAWDAQGLMGTAQTAMISDIVFIFVYGIGAVLGGLYFRSTASGLLRLAGSVLAIAGAVFFATDMVETTLQLVQVVNAAGDDTLAGIASQMGPTKVAAFLITFFGLAVALVAEWFSSRAA